MPGQGCPVAREALLRGDPSRVGRYRLLARLGAGGMGVVYLGVTNDGRQVAVKVLRPELADDPEFRARFRREVATLVKVKGLCTVRVIEADTESPQPFLVTEYAHGPTLAEYMNLYGPLGSDMLYGLATGLAEALAAIHAAGVVHRDLKPSNVILTDSGPKVIDFGIAQAMDSTAVTRTGMMIGTVGFMPPEQVTGQAGQAADIFAWAVTIGYAASGQQPFGTGATYAVMYRVMHAEPDMAAVPDTLRPLVDAALAKDPEDRPSAQELLDRLTCPYAQAADGCDTPTRTALSRTWRPVTPSGVVPGEQRPRGGRAVPRLIGLLLAILVAVAGTAAALTMSGRPVATHTTGNKPSHAASTTPPSATAHTADPKPAKPSPAAVTTPATTPFVTIGTYTGTKPIEIDFSADAGNVVLSIEWVSWTATGATGYGTSPIKSCNPSCATGAVTQVPATITLSRPVNGRFTVMTETRQGSTVTLDYPGSWALGAS
jgi:eukaryotic-like serine/threonine-protein kinase